MYCYDSVTEDVFPGCAADRVDLEANGGARMKQNRQGRPVAETLRALSKEEIDHRMQQVIDEVAASGATGPSSESSVEPRWISPAELVRRMRRFVVYN